MKRWDGYQPGNLGTCRICGDPIRWMLTPRGRRMPTDAATVDEGETLFDAHKHISHFATCAQGDAFRVRTWQKKGPPRGGPVSGGNPF